MRIVVGVMYWIFVIMSFCAAIGDEWQISMALALLAFVVGLPEIVISICNIKKD